MKRRRKSQAALEFLTTYGWAFIVILATIGAMTYFGVIDPKKFIPDRCMFGTEFECKDYRLAIMESTGSDRADFILVNAIGDTINVERIDCIYPSGTSEPGRVLANASTTFRGWHSGTAESFYCYTLVANSGGFIIKEKQKVKISLTYTFGTQGFPHLIDGEIFSTIAQTD